MRTAIYTRVSTDMQVEEGFSLDAQLDRLKSYCDSQDWSIVGIYTDEGQSAKTTNRPELQRMLNDIVVQKIDVVLVYKLDRLTRNVLDLYELMQTFDKHNVGFKSATEVFDTTTAMGRLFITIVAALAQWERENLAERVRMGQMEMAKQGKKPGGSIPFGYNSHNGKLVINHAQSEVVRGIFSRFLSGQGSKRILAWLNSENNPQLAPNKRWTFTALKYLLDNPVYAGYIRYGHRGNLYRQHRPIEAIIQESDHEPIITKEQFERVKQIRASRKRNPSRAGTGTYPFTGLLRCGVCGSSMCGITKYNKNKEKSEARRYYTCVERAGSNMCDMPIMNEKKLEKAILDSLEQYYEDMSNKVIELQPQTHNHEQKRLEIERELAKLKQRRQRWMDGFEENLITAAELRERLDEIISRESSLKNQLDELNSDSITMDISSVMSILKSFRSSWETVDVLERKELIRLIVEKIEVLPDLSLNITFL